MKRPPFAWFRAGAFVAAGLVAWLPIHIGGIHGYLRPTLPLAFAWLGLLLAGLVLYRWRGLWLLLTAPPALFWLYAGAVSVVCARGCG